MNISVYLEGGIGDVLLGHKLAWVLKSTVYPDAVFSAFLDTEGNPMQERVLRYLFPTFYKEIFTIPRKKYKKLIINSQFGEEEVKGFFINVPDEWQEKIKNYDRTFNFHIDSLSYLGYKELDWVKYFKSFPKPEINPPDTIFNKYILSNIISATGTEHKMEGWYVDRLISDIDKFCQQGGYEHLIISTPEINKLYNFKNCPKTSFFNGSVEDVCNLIANCDGFVGIDSAWRLISHMFDKPTITLSKNCADIGNVPISHQIRWLPFPETTFPLYANSKILIDLFSGMMQSKLYHLFPGLVQYKDNLDQVLIKRNIKIDEEKSILND